MLVPAEENNHSALDRVCLEIDIHFAAFECKGFADTEADLDLVGTGVARK